jgi:hypothetical protein
VKKGAKKRPQWYMTLPDELTGRWDPEDEQMALILLALATGNVHPLIDYIRKGPQLIGPLQDFFVALLLRKVKFPKRRPKNPDTWRRHFDIAWFVAVRKRNNVKHGEAIGEAEDKFGVDRRTVQRAIKGMRLLLGSPQNMESFLTLFALSGNNLAKARVTIKAVPWAWKEALMARQLVQTWRADRQRNM